MSSAVDPISARRRLDPGQEDHSFPAVQVFKNRFRKNNSIEMELIGKTINREAIGAESHIRRAVRPVGHDLELGEVALVGDGSIRLDVECQQIFAAFLREVGK